MTLQKKLPFKDYTVMNCSVATSLGCADVFRFYVLSLTADRENKTDTTLEQLADFVGEKATAYHGGGNKNSRKLSLTDRFRASHEFECITLEKEISNITGKEVSRNHYVFPKAREGKYRRVKKEFRELELSVKLKGYLLQLFCLAEPHSLLVRKSCNNIATLLSMGNSTVKAYNQVLEGMSLLEGVEEGLLLHVDCFIIDSPNNSLKPKYKEFIKWMEEVDIPRRISDAYAKHQPVLLTGMERAYLYHKEKGFEGIRSMNNFMRYIKTGLHYKKREKPVSPYPPIIL